MQCPSCNTSLSPDERYAMLVVCPACRSAIVPDEDRLRLAGTMGVLAPTTSGLAVGATGTLDGTGFIVLGRVGYRYEDGQWDEWFLLSDAGEEIWLTEDPEGLRLEQRLVVNIAIEFDKIRLGKVLRIGKSSYRAIEKGVAVCIGGDGQLPFVVEPDEEVPFIDCAGRDNTATIELFDQRDVVIYIGQSIGMHHLTVTSGGSGGAVAAAGGKIHSADDRTLDLKCFACAAPLPLPEDDARQITCGHCGSNTDLTFERIECQSCGVTLPVSDGERSGSVTCPSCHATHRIDNQVATVLQSFASGKRPRVTFKLGQKCTFNGVDYRIAGHLRFTEREAGISFISDEFLLVDLSDRSYRWLVEYQGHYSLVKTVGAPTDAPTPRLWHAGSKITAAGKRWRVGAGRATGTITWIEGELPWVAQCGDSITYVEAAAPPELIEVEIGENEHEWLRGHYVEPDVVAKAFGMDVNKLPRRRSVVWHQPYIQSPMWGPVRRASGFAALAFFVLAIASGMMRSKVAEFTLTPQSFDEQAGYKSPSFTIDDPGVCELVCDANVSNEWMYLQCLLVDESSEAAIHEFSQEISYYYGNDWSEGSTSDSAVFIVEEPATYHLFVPDVQQGRGEQPDGRFTRPVTMKVYEGVLLTRWFVTGTVLAGLLWGLLLLGPIIHYLRRMSSADLLESDDD